MAPLLSSKNQTFVFEGDFQGLHVRLDRRRIVQVLMNLVSNAHKYSPAGTTITMEGRVKDGNLQMAIIDQGIGISASDQVRLFTKFFRVDNETTRSVGGTGLGLSITQEIVTAHGGSIGVSSQIGQGTRFSVTIPIGMPAPPTATSPESAAYERPTAPGDVPATERATPSRRLSADSA